MITKEFDEKYYHPFLMFLAISLSVVLLGLFAPAEVSAQDSGDDSFTELCLFTPNGDECVSLSGYFQISDDGTRVLSVVIPNIPEKEGGIVQSNTGKPLLKFQL